MFSPPLLKEIFSLFPPDSPDVHPRSHFPTLLCCAVLLLRSGQLGKKKRIKTGRVMNLLPVSLSFFLDGWMVLGVQICLKSQSFDSASSCRENREVYHSKGTVRRKTLEDLTFQLISMFREVGSSPQSSSKVTWNHFLRPITHQVGMKRGDRTEADAAASIFSDVIGYLKSKSSADENG